MSALFLRSTEFPLYKHKHFKEVKHFIITYNINHQIVTHLNFENKSVVKCMIMRFLFNNIALMLQFPLKKEKRHKQHNTDKMTASGKRV